MAVDYNLVILGGSLVARHAAIRAARWGARVALIEPLRSPSTRLTCTGRGSFSWELEQLQLTYLQTNYRREMPSSRQATLAQAQALAAWQLEQNAPAQLATYGIDVVVGNGKFTSPPKLGVQVGDRLLRGHSYLVAIDAEPSATPGLEGHDFTLTKLQQPPLSSVGVWGIRTHSFVLAQVLQRLGLSVVLANPAPRLLPGASQSIAELLQAQLEAEGVRIVTAATLAPPSSAANSTASPTAVMIQSDALTIAVDGVVAAEAHCPGLLTLDLPPQIKAIADGIPVNASLQTAHPQIYACGYAVNAYSPVAVAIAEAGIAVDNALSIPYRRIRYRTIPRLIPTDPPSVRVGLTEQQARHRHGDVTVVRQSLGPLRQAQLEQTSVGLCQLVLSKRGIVLGAEAVGPNVQDWFSPLTWAVTRRMTLQALTRTWPNPAYSEVIEQLAEQWRYQRQPSWKRDGKELLLNWRRDWTR